MNRGRLYTGLRETGSIARSLWVNTQSIHMVLPQTPTRYSHSFFAQLHLLRDLLSTLSTPLTITSTLEKKGI